jgi:drug/metabolite transporter (DMT)-like permease
VGPAARREGILALIIVVLAWGLTWPVNKVVLLSLSPLWTGTLRSAIATVALFALTAWRGRVELPPRPQVDWSPSFTLLLLYLGIGGTAVAYWAAATASRLLPAVTTSLGLLATPLVSVMTAMLWLGRAADRLAGGRHRAGARRRRHRATDPTGGDRAAA